VAKIIPYVFRIMSRSCRRDTKPQPGSPVGSRHTPQPLPGTADNTLVIQPRGTELVAVIAWLLASAPPPMGAPVKDQQTGTADNCKPRCGGVDAMGPSRRLHVIVHYHRRAPGE